MGKDGEEERVRVRVEDRHEARLRWVWIWPFLPILFYNIIYITLFSLLFFPFYHFQFTGLGLAPLSGLVCNSHTNNNTPILPFNIPIVILSFVLKIVDFCFRVSLI